MTEEASFREWLASELGATGSVFHYTSPEGLLGVLNSGSLWASEASSLNDVAEIRQGWAFVNAWLDEQPSDEVVEDFREYADRDTPHVLTEATPAQTFVLCGSVDGDDANQWRNYGAGGFGYVLELEGRQPLCVVAGDGSPPTPDADGLRNLGILFQNSLRVTPWLRCLYGDESKDRALRSLLEMARRRAETQPDFESQLDSQEWRDEGVGDHAEGLSTIAHLIKSRGFEGEHEVRVVATFLSPGVHLRFRASRVGVVRCALLTGRPKDAGNLLFPQHGPQILPVTGVKIGPGLDAESNREAIEGLLKARGYDSATVTASAVPLRH